MLVWADRQRWSTVGRSFPLWWVVQQRSAKRAETKSRVSQPQQQQRPEASVRSVLLCSGVNLRERLSPALAVSPDYTDMPGLSEQKPGAFADHCVCPLLPPPKKSTEWAPTLARLWNLVLDEISYPRSCLKLAGRRSQTG